MSISLALIDNMPESNPDLLFFQATFAGNAGVLGVGDYLNLSVYESGGNPGGFTDPALVGEPYPKVPPIVPVLVLAENLGGYYVQVTKGTTLQNFALRMFAPGGGELASNSAYPAAVTGGNVILGFKLSQF